MVGIKNTITQAFVREAYKWLVLVVIYSICIYMLRNNTDEQYVCQVCVISSVVFLSIQVYRIYVLLGTFLSPCLIFLGLYYIFQNGLLLLFAFDDSLDSVYLKQYRTYVVPATIYASISNVIAGSACILAILKTNRPKLASHIDRQQTKDVFFAGYYGYLFTGLIAVPLVLLKFNVARVGGYFGVRIFEESVPFYVAFIEYMFMPFAVLCLVYCEGRIKTKIFITWLTVLWLLLTAYCGDRTVGLSGILIISFISLRSSMRSGMSKKSLVKFGVIIVFLMVMVQSVAIVRSQGDISTIGEDEGVFYHFISELGFSSFSLFTMMDIVPNQEGYLKGMGYLSSFVCGLVPVNADPTGFVRWLLQWHDLYDTVWPEKYLPYSFGLGFSLNSESYVNFGWFGFIPLFLIDFVIFYFLNFSSSRRTPSKFDIYTSYILLFLWCTLPRRDSYYLWKALVYSIFLIRVYLYLLVSRKKRTSHADQISNL